MAEDPRRSNLPTASERRLTRAINALISSNTSSTSSALSPSPSAVVAASMTSTVTDGQACSESTPKPASSQLLGFC